MNSIRVASAHCRSSKSSTTGPRSPTCARKGAARRRRAPPCREQRLRRSRADSHQSGLDKSSLLRIRGECAPRPSPAPSPRARYGVLPFRDLCAHANHLRERPERDSLTVGEAPSAVPPDVLGETVDVLEELPAQAGFSDAGDAHDGHKVRSSLRRARVEKFLDEAELLVPSHERRLQTHRLERSTPPRRNPQRPPGSDPGSVFPLSWCSPAAA